MSSLLGFVGTESLEEFVNEFLEIEITFSLLIWFVFLLDKKTEEAEEGLAV